MNPYIEKMKNQLVESSPAYGDCDAKALLEMLYCCYCTANPIDDAAICDRFMELDGILKGLTPEEYDEIFSLACALCAEYERQGFLEGIRIGVRLIDELSEEN